MKVEKRYYGDGEDSYEMTKFFRPEVESVLMKKVPQPLISEYPGAVYPLVEYPEYGSGGKKEAGENESKGTVESGSEERKESQKAKKHQKKRKKKR